MFDIKRAEAAWDRHNSAQLRSFLAQEDRQANRERRLEEAEARHFKELIADPAVIIEAIQESSWDEAMQIAIAGAFNEKDNAKLGAVIRGGITAYITSFAIKMAEKEVDE